MAGLILKKNEERRLKQGHLWVFSNEIGRLEGSASNGDLIEVYDFQNNFLGTGFYNANSLISVRMISFEKEFSLEQIFTRRLESAYALRKELYPERDSFRLIFSESDFLPGLIIDKYNSTFVLQVYSAGMEKNIELVVKILTEKLSAKNIFTKNEEYFRKLEGLQTEDKIYLGSIEEEIVFDGQVKYKVNFPTGHKTGFYFDQCDNRAFAARYCKDKTVLDCFCNSGGFGLNAALSGAAEVVFADSSQEEIKNAQQNFLLNDLKNKSEFIQSDVFDYLEKCIAEKKKFDVVILDPPAFAKNKKNLPQAIKGYEKLNRLGIELLNEGGLLFTSSCSYHLKEDIFLGIINKAAQKSMKNIQLFYFNNASLDHPCLPAMEETSYLKFAAFRVSLK